MTTKTAGTLFREHTRLGSLKAAYHDRIALQGGAGLDRIEPRVFDQRKHEELRVAYRKLVDGSYRFTPYLEELLTKGRDKTPRVLSIPTVRDRLVLHQLKTALHELFPERVGRTLPNAFVRETRKFLDASGNPDTVILRADIEGFYDSLDHGVLEAALRERMRSSRLLTILLRAIKTPTVPPGYRRREKGKYRHTTGVPQGLSISNILANIYLGDLDEELSVHVPFAARYVDDIVLIGSATDVAEGEAFLGNALKSLGLSLNSEKTYQVPFGEPFEYLGYRFSGADVSVRERTLDRYINKLAARFTAFRDGIETLTRERPWLSRDELKQIFVEELNEGIAGAVSENRRYGWLFYFAEINDMGLLHRLDYIVASFFERSPLFGTVPDNLKRFVRGYYEVRHRPRAGYVVDYDTFSTLGAQEDYLRRFGLIDPQRGYQPGEISALFERERAKHLARLEMDVGTMS